MIITPLMALIAGLILGVIVTIVWRWGRLVPVQLLRIAGIETLDLIDKWADMTNTLYELQHQKFEILSGYFEYGLDALFEYLEVRDDDPIVIKIHTEMLKMKPHCDKVDTDIEALESVASKVAEEIKEHRKSQL